MAEPADLQCMNCDAAVMKGQAKFFANVFVCSTCFEKAERFYVRSMEELKMLQTALRERIRMDLLHKRFFVGDNRNFEEVPKADVFRAIGQLEEAKAASRKPR